RLPVVRLGFFEAALVQVEEREQLQRLSDDAMVRAERLGAHLERAPEPLLGLLALAAPVEQDGEIQIALAQVRVLGAETLLEHGLRGAAVRLRLVEPVDLLAEDAPVAQVDRRLDGVVAE